MTHNKRRFLTAKDMAELKYDEAVELSAAKRRGENPVGVRQTICGCGAEGCSYTTTLDDSGAFLPKQKKGTPTRMPKRPGFRYAMTGPIIKRSDLDAILAVEPAQHRFYFENK